MRICKNCGAEMIDDEIRYCSRCGADLSKKENLSEKTISDIIDTDVGIVSDEEVYVKFKVKKRWIAAVLQMIIGFTGASFLYLGFYLKGAIWVVLNIIFFISAIWWGPMAFFMVFFINIALGLGWLFKKDLIDAKGNDLK